MTNYSNLKKHHRQIREQQNPNLSIRIHRALSWLNRAELCEDQDSKFIFLWISLNAAYAHEFALEQRPREQEFIFLFLEKLTQLDRDNRLENLVWGEFSKSLRAMLNNKYIFQPYWDYLNGKISESDWKDRFQTSKNIAAVALGKRNTPKVLDIVLSRLYTLRNQLMHGGATWDSQINRKQIQDCAKFMGYLVPAVIEIMLGSVGELWGEPCYPVIYQ